MYVIECVHVCVLVYVSDWVCACVCIGVCALRDIKNQIRVYVLPFSIKQSFSFSVSASLM